MIFPEIFLFTAVTQKDCNGNNILVVIYILYKLKKKTYLRAQLICIYVQYIAVDVCVFF